MPRRQKLRSKTGRLSRKAIKTLIGAARKPREGEAVAILKSGKAKSKRGRDGDRMDLIIRPSEELYFDGDCRTLVRGLQVALASHYSESLTAQVDPEDGSPLPKPKRDPDGKYLFDTGGLAAMWGIGTLRGSSNSFKASGTVFPTKDRERAAAVNSALRRSGKRGGPVDLQGVKGTAAEIIEDTVALWMEASFGARIYTPVLRGAGETNLRKL